MSNLREKERAGLDSLTDYVTEQEVDKAKVSKALAALAEREAKEQEEAKARDAALAAIEVKKEDVELVAAEFDLTDAEATLKLKENDGDLAATLDAMSRV